jgi:hypothetical protein
MICGSEDLGAERLSDKPLLSSSVFACARPNFRIICNPATAKTPDM